MNTVMITGCSSGFGLETARHFLEHGWSVIATMRNPVDGLLPASSRLRLLPLDVTDDSSIAAAVELAGDVDVLVNNAGVGWLNALEGTPMPVVRNIFETNTFGTMALIQAMLPQFRARKAGVIVNVTSSVTLKPLELLSVYTASKAAVNAFSEVLALELRPFGVRTHVVLPGRSPETRFGANAQARMAQGSGFPEPYVAMVQGILARFASELADQVTLAQDVAQAVWCAATDPAAPKRIPAGTDAVALFQG